MNKLEKRIINVLKSHKDLDMWSILGWVNNDGKDEGWIKEIDEIHRSLDDLVSYGYLKRHETIYEIIEEINQ